MSTKAQKIFAKFIRSTHQAERALFKGWLDEHGVKMSQVAYIKDGHRFTAHGNIPFHKQGEVTTPAPEPKQKSKYRPRTQPSYDYGTQPSRSGFRNIKRNAPEPPPRRQYSEDGYWDSYVKTSPDWTL